MFFMEIWLLVSAAAILLFRATVLQICTRFSPPVPPLCGQRLALLEGRKQDPW